MESINLGAVLFGILLLLWLAYALPRTANRRDVMGRARVADQTGTTPQARDLSAAVHARRTPIEGNQPMSQDRLILRPADPTRRPRFDADPGTRIDPVQERSRSRRMLGLVLGLLVTGTLALGAFAALGAVSWWLPALAGAGMAVYLIGLRRAELDRRARATRAATRARREHAEQETARRRELRGDRTSPRAGATGDGEHGLEDSRAADRATAQRVRSGLEDATRTDADGAAGGGLRADHAVPAAREGLEQTSERAARQVARPGEWTPRPVPRPTYALRGEVDDLASRHAAHRQGVQARSVPLESEHVEELEAVDEALAPAQDLRLDEILARRRA